MAEQDIHDREITTSRVVDAPRQRVWQAFTDPKQVVLWWGPNGFTNTNHEMTVKVGGVWRFTMHGSDGVDYKNKIVYTDIVELERLSYDHSGEDELDLAGFHSTITFEDLGDKTKVTLTAVFASAEEREKQVKMGAIEGGEQTLGRLADFVKKH